MRIIDSILAELDQEAVTTKKVLERVPQDKLDWKPHEKSMTFGQLALHVATTPGGVAEHMTKDEMEMPDLGNYDQPKTTEEILSALDDSLSKARQILNDMDDKAAMSHLKITKGGQEVMSMPKIGMARAILLNHWYHHRGQLCVYLRLQDLPVPAVYGPSADENPFGG